MLKNYKLRRLLLATGGYMLCLLAIYAVYGTETILNAERKGAGTFNDSITPQPTPKKDKHDCPFEYEDAYLKQLEPDYFA